MTAIANFFRNEALAIYMSISTIFGALNALGVLHLTDTQIGAVVAIAGVIMGPLLRSNVTPVVKGPKPVPPPLGDGPIAQGQA